MIEKNSNLDSLTGFRGVVSLWILTAHFLFMPAYGVGFGSKIELGYLYGILRFDFLGVDLFIMLSGFFIYRMHRYDFEVKPVSKSIDRFYLKRLARLYPMHLFTLGVMWVIHISGIPHPIFSGRQDLIFEYWPATLALNLVLMNSWGFIPVSSWNEPAWTISGLMFTYLIFPTWAFVPKALKSVKAQIIGIVVMLALSETAFRMIDGITASDGIGSLVRCVTLFMIGCFTYNLYEKKLSLQGKWNDIVFIAIMVLLCAGITLFVFVKTFPLLLLYLFYPALLLVLTGKSPVVRSIFANRVTMFLGKISYSTYLIHYPFLLVATHFLGNYFANAALPQWLYWLSFLGVLVAACLTSALCSYTIEKPSYRWLKQKLKLNPIVPPTNIYPFVASQKQPISKVDYAASSDPRPQKRQLRG